MSQFNLTQASKITMFFGCYLKLFLVFLYLSISACSQKPMKTLVTIADARVQKAHLTDSGETGDSPGDVLTFDQPLLNISMKQIGNNSGFCIRTRVSYSFQCQWSLLFDDGTIQVEGLEFDQGTSSLSIVGGTGIYSGISGEMKSTNNNDGTFTQALYYQLK